MLPKPILPPRLRPQARIALIAPSGPLRETDHLTRGIELCEALGYRPVPMPNVTRSRGYLAGTDAERLADLNTALTDPGIDAVWALRGGNGLNRIVDQVDFDGFAARPRPVIGYSDLTVLLHALTTTTGIVTFHGPMARFAMTPFVRRSLDAILTEPHPAGALESLPGNDRVLVPERGRVVTVIPGRATGRLIGGNLTLFQALVGTRYMPSLAGAILFLEDVNEEVHRIDRMLGHLRLAGHLDAVAGVAIGHFSRMRHPDVDGVAGLDTVLRHYFGPRNIPVAHGFPIGHVAEQWTLPIGVNVAFDATHHQLEILEPAVH